MRVDVDALYRRYGPMVLRRCRRLLANEEDAVEAMQDVFVKMLRYQDQLEDRAPSSLLYCMATNVCLNRIRSQKRGRAAYDNLVWEIATSEDQQRFGARDILQRVFGKEQHSTMLIAVLHLLDGMTLEEVAREVGLSVSGVRKRLRSLRSRVGQLEAV